MDQLLSEIRARNERILGQERPYMPVHDPEDKRIWREPGEDPSWRASPIVEILDTRGIEDLTEEEERYPPRPAPVPKIPFESPRTYVTSVSPDTKLLRNIARHVVNHKIR
eukprot:TRINITY_DN12149_c0_g2_i1.p1 TRINITY_DN12149_c0_g2~~TRINITY_DN12149_c0_g2_i1.p1  ORF type:complete len:110 (+),score=11.24 TRINITY_DN12149_c0_g2_i1:82-411(+)